MQLRNIKRSAIHNLRLLAYDHSSPALPDGLVLPRALLGAADIAPFEQIVVANITRGTRMLSFVIPGPDGRVTAHGSLAFMLSPGDLFCIITRAYCDHNTFSSYYTDAFPILDIGFPADNATNCIHTSLLNLEFSSVRQQRDFCPDSFLTIRRTSLARIALEHMVHGLVVNSTHSNCLQGSAEIPRDVMEGSGLQMYQSVHVYNLSDGGVSETYVVPTPPTIVMTTGSMSRFAPKGSTVGVASFVISHEPVIPNILFVVNNSSKDMKPLLLNDFE